MFYTWVDHICKLKFWDIVSAQIKIQTVNGFKTVFDDWNILTVTSYHQVEYT